MNLLDSLKKPLPIPEPYSYSQKILDHLTNTIDLPADTTKSLSNFYNEEIKRANKKFEVIRNRCEREQSIVDIIPQLSLLVEEFSTYTMDCKESLSRLGPSVLTSFNYMDIKKEINHTFYRHSQLAIINSLLRSISLFPLTRRRSIFEFFVETSTSMYEKDKTMRYVATFITQEEAMDEHIHRLAKLYQIDQDIDESDGQSFTYKCDKTFYTLFHKLTMSELPRKKVDVPQPNLTLALHELIHANIFNKLSVEHKIVSVFEKLRTYEDHQITNHIREQASFYNSFVGNGLLNKRLNIPQYKVYTWLELRWTHLKFLWEMFTSYINYFQYVKYYLAHPDCQFTVRQSESFKELIEVCDEKGPFIFAATDEVCQNSITKFAKICGYFIGKSDGVDVKLIDRELVALEILELEVKLCAAKHALIAPLLEILEHVHEKSIIDHIYKTITIIPAIDISIAHTFTFPYTILIDTIQMQAKITRKLVNTQIMHLRQLSARTTAEIPIFDRPHLIPSTHKRIIQDGGIETSIFEVYESLGDIGKIFVQMPKLIPEFLESANIKVEKFYPYMCYTVWHELDAVLTEGITQGVFPYDGMPLSFGLNLSDSASSLFSSNFINSLSPLEKLLGEMNEGRKIKLLLSTRRMFNYVWSTQDEILKTIELQKSYLAQCKKIGMTDISVQMTPFTMMQSGSTETMQEDLVEFALYEFHPVNIDFTNITFIKDLLFTSNFKGMDEIYKAQKQQNMYLETAIRYNDFMLDALQFADLFYFNISDDSTVFVTNSEANDTLENEAMVYNKQFVASLVFFESQSIPQSVKKFTADKTDFTLNIKKIKQQIRTNLMSHTKHSSKNSPEVKSMYFSELIDAFSSYLFRIEIARVCDCERRLLLTHSFVETFLLGPVEGQQFVNEAGRYENFFYVPTWVEVFSMMRQTGLPRQSAVLKWVLPFVIQRLRILSFIRYIACLDQKTETVFESIASQQMNVETTQFQKLLNEFQRLPNSRDVDVLAAFVQDKELFYIRLFECTLLSAFDSCFVQMKSELNVGGKRDHYIATGTKELKLGEVIKIMIVDLHKKLPTDTFSSQRYVSPWENEFAYRLKEDEKQSLAKLLVETESFLETSLAVLKNQSYLDNFQMVQPLTDFAENLVARDFIKYAYFQVLSKVDYRTITVMSSVTKLNQNQFLKGNSIWVDVILKEALQKITPQGEPVYKKVPKGGMPKYVAKIIEVAEDHFETEINDMQAAQLQEMSSQILSGLSVERHKLEDLVPETFVLTLHKGSKDEFLITPKEASKQFDEELVFCKATLINKVNQILEASIQSTSAENFGINQGGSDLISTKSLRSVPSTAEVPVRRNRQQVFTLRESFVQSECAILSDLFQTFISSSLHDEIFTWKQYNLSAINVVQQKMEREEATSIVEKFILKRHASETAAQVRLLYEPQIFKVNELEDIRRKTVHSWPAMNIAMEKEIRGEYDGLVSDLQKKIDDEKMTFIVRRKKIYQTILDVLKKDYSINESSINPKQKPGTSKEKNQKILDDLAKENQESLKHIKILRIIRVLKMIAMNNSFNRKLQAAESDRKSVNASLWSNRLTYEMHGAEMEDQLFKAQQRLNESEINLENVKHTLAVEKSSNIDMVQWKATNANKIVDLKQEIDKVRLSKDTPNIGKLLVKIEQSQEMLDKLVDETDAIDKEREETVTTTQRKIDRVRTSVEQTRISRLNFLRSGAMEPPSMSREDIQKYQMLQEENQYYRKANDQLRREVAYYEEIMQRQSNQTIKYLEKTVLAGRAKSSAIVKPVANTQKITSRSLNSRLDPTKKRTQQNIFI